jgi:hypothetical protein
MASHRFNPLKSIPSRVRALAGSAAAWGALALSTTALASPQSAEPAPAKRASSTHTHVAHTQKAGGSGLDVSAKTPASMAVGVPTRVTLTFDAASSAGATARVLNKRGLSVTSLDGSALSDIPLRQGGTTVVDVLVTAAGDGAQHFAVATMQEGRTSVRAVPLKVGSGKLRLKTEGTLVTTPSGEKIISMPAK